MEVQTELASLRSEIVRLIDTVAEHGKRLDSLEERMVASEGREVARTKAAERRRRSNKA